MTKEQKRIINERLEFKLKYQNTEDDTDTLRYKLNDLKTLCNRYSYNLVIDKYFIAVYPLKEDCIAKGIPYIKEYIDSFCGDSKEESLAIAINYICKEILFIK